MAEYIEREATIKALKENTTKMEGCIGFSSNVGVPEDEIEDIINGLPKADVESVVRCKDCKHHHWEQEPCHGKTVHTCSVLKAEIFKDFYCYHGERSSKK